MSAILVLSIGIRLIAFFISLRVWHRIRDWRIGFLALMLLLMAVRQGWTLIERTQDWHTLRWQAWEELPGLVVSVIALAAVFCLERMFTELRRRTREDRLFNDILRHTFEDARNFFTHLLQALLHHADLPLQQKAAIWLKNEEREPFRCIAQIGDPPQPSRPLFSCPLKPKPCADSHEIKTIEIDAKGIVRLCLKGENGCCGWIELYLHPDSRLNPRDTRLLEHVGQLASLAYRRQQADRRIAYQAHHDALTGLYNRHAFQTCLETALKDVRHGAPPYVLCYFDLDQFKLVNDTCSHAAGDALLCQIAQLIRQQLTPGDCFARLGGDEFALLLRHCPLDRALERLQKIRATLNDWPFVWEGRTFHVSASFGVVPLSSEPTSAETALSHADAACFLAKDYGRNRIQIYRSSDLEISQRRQEMNWIARLEQALKENRFELYAQPIVPIGQISRPTARHYEILLRLPQSNGVEPPASFLSAAERYHLMPRIDRWVVCRTLTLLSRHSNPTTRFSINLSGQSLGDPELLALIQEGCQHFDPKRLCFEITETAAITHLAQTQPFLATLKSLGCRLALDDFGAGFSSYAYLKRLPVDYLKIDGQFIRNLSQDPVDLAMVRSINEVAHILGKRTVAEFVESEAIMQQLIELGVDYAQGFFVGQPVPLKTVLQTQPQTL
ncbi:hypothetical protein MIN45_P0763 [Methylomarinovum tepidoasis]|uniref:EAL domain-containing protein n=1 Tax=Methylomarinovum tepidoasis TaxID=2840183 RepID=A0AAU9CW61_9GAMM|nr:EAL domain-containing protein [Methylomarinovum sp. IN45]BCX88394.1 hypothetical protein MIN45_P0763 [Methylomarinovum sp. IN45]